MINEDGQSIASAPITLTAPETSVSGPESAVAGSRIEVSWTNTIHHRDKVTIVPADARAMPPGITCAREFGFGQARRAD